MTLRLLALLATLCTPWTVWPAPPGMESLFNGENLEGWVGLGHTNPAKWRALSAAQRVERLAENQKSVDAHWRVENGEIVNDGHGVFLTTGRDYGDFELHLEWRMMKPGADSGIYLRGCPQVQIWDIQNEGERKNGAHRGSGALWNNNPETPGRFPTRCMDRPVGEWNSFRIRMVGSRVRVIFNGAVVVDHARMHNYFDRSRPVFREGPIQLQTHGGEMRFRNIAIREISPDEANEILGREGLDGFDVVFNGRDLTGWSGATASYEIEDHSLRCKPQHGGTIFTQREYGDFAARLQFRLPPGGNNGLAIRYPGEGDTAYVGMCELQVLDNTAEKYAKLDSRQYHGSAYAMVPAHRGFLRAPGEWNFQEVTVKGSTIRVELNGSVILDCDLGDVKEFMHGSPHPGMNRKRGHFGFAGHHDPVSYRHIWIRELGQ